MERKIYYFEKSKWKTLALIFAIISIVASFFAAWYAATNSYRFLPYSFQGDIMLAFVILTGITSGLAMILTIVAFFGSAKVFKASSAFTAISQCCATVCVLVLATSPVGDFFRAEIGMIFFVLAALLFISAWVLFLVTSSKSRKNESAKKGFKIASVIMALVIAFVVAVEIFGCFTHVSADAGEKTYYSETYTARQQALDNDYYLDTYISFYENGDYGYAMYKEIADSNSDYYDSSDEALDALALWCENQNEYSDFNKYINVDVFPQISFHWNISTNSPVKKYVAEIYPAIGSSDFKYSYRAFVLTEKFYDIVYSPREVFEREHPGVNLGSSPDYRITYESSRYEANGHIVVTAYESVNYFRMPNIFWLVMSVLGMVSVALVTLRCNIAEKAIVTQFSQATIANGGAEFPGVADGGQTADLTGIVKLSIVKHILLSFVTLGIYGYVWFYRNAQNVRRINGESTRGCGDEVLLRIIGGPLYGIYWYYTRAKQVRSSAQRFGLEKYFLSPSVYLILALLTGSLFPMAVMTANFNKVFADLTHQGKNAEPDNGQKAKLSKRQSLLKMVLLSIVTFGIYFAITKVRISNKIKLLSGKQCANTKQLICMLFVPFYWIIWLCKRKGEYGQCGDEATLEAWLLLVVPMYSVYWLISRNAELRNGANRFGVNVTEESVWTALMSLFTPMLAYANMLVDLNKVADNAVNVPLRSE